MKKKTKYKMLYQEISNKIFSIDTHYLAAKISKTTDKFISDCFSINFKSSYHNSSDLKLHHKFRRTG